MREFKFRAWHKVERCMLGMSSAYHYGQEYQGEVFSWKNEGQPITIMQYTGMKDCEGVEIYEGDLLALNNSNKRASYEIYEVKYDQNRTQFLGVAGKYYDTVADIMSFDDGSGRYVVIGNIYETPELLE